MLFVQSVVNSYFGAREATIFSLYGSPRSGSQNGIVLIGHSSEGDRQGKGDRSSRSYLMGLALDYCVKHGALDGRHLGLNAHVIVEGCRGIELDPGDIDRALEEMKHAGAVLLKSSDV